MTGLTSVLLLASVAGPPALEWRAPDGCPTASDVLQSLAVLAGHAELEQVRARGVIRRSGGQYELRLDVHTGRLSQRRSLRADTCDTLGEAAALLIAIVIDPVEVAAQLAVEPAPRRPREIAPEVPVAVEVPERVPEPALPPAPPRRAKTREPLFVRRIDPPPQEPPARDTRFIVRVEGAFDAGAFRPSTGDLVGLVGILHQQLRVELQGLYTPPRALVSGGQRGTIARWALGARLCGRFVRSVFEASLCGGLEGGQFRPTGAVTIVARQTNPTPAAQSAPEWFAALLGLGVVWSPHPRVGLGVRTEFVLAPLRRNIYVGYADVPVDPGEEIGPAFYTEAMGVRVSGGFEVRFGPGARRDGSARSRPQSR